MPKPNDERAADGTPILRHEPRETSGTIPATAGHLEEVERHFETHFGPVEEVFHEIVSDLVHLDVHLIRPVAGRNHWTLFTTGMSALPMTPPSGAEDQKWAELVLFLPGDWELDRIKAAPPPADLERWYWPVRWLKTLARLPHEYRTWLAAGHTVPNGDPPAPFADGTKLCCWLLLPPVSVPTAARRIALTDGRSVNLYALHALHLEEVTLKLNKGLDALLDAFERAGVSEVLAPDRQPAARRKLLGLL
jgi:hypothetical protein